MNLPNLLTLLRIFFVPLLVAALLADGTSRIAGRAQCPISREIFALAVFLIAAATDLLDGWLARRWGQVTTVGTLLDPIADKLLISAALVSLVDIHRVAGVDRDPDHRPGVRGVGLALDRGGVRLHHHRRANWARPRWPRRWRRFRW